MNLDRLSGAFIMLVGLVLLYIVIPIGVETVDATGLTPRTFPVLISWSLVVVGAFQVLLSKKSEVQTPSGLLRIGFLCLCFALSLYCASLIGFIFVSPILALILMLFMNERRPFWLALGSLAVPLTIWLCIHVLLGRELI